MSPFRAVLCPIDLAEDVERRLPFMRSLAKQLSAQLHLLYVVREFDFARGIFIPHENVDQMEKDYRGAAEAKMRRLREESFGDDPDVTTAVAFGDPAEEILRYAAAQKIDLIAVCTHGRHGLEHAIFGSVAEKVVKRSGVPVLTIRPQYIQEHAAS